MTTDDVDGDEHESEPLDPGRYVATLDRFETLGDGSELAVFVVESADGPLTQLELPRAVVPGDGCHADGVFELVLAADSLELRHRPEETEARRESARERFERLARRPPSDEE